MNKPPGCITARVDLRGRPTVYDHVPASYPSLPHTGRLDFNTEGLLLFTDDGRLQQALLNGRLRARNGLPPIEKEYHVKVRGILGPEDPRLVEMSEPLLYQGSIATQPARVRFVAHRTRATWLSVTITEGRNHQVRLLCGRSRLQVIKLRRVRLGPLHLGDLPLRWCRPLTWEEARSLYEAAMPGVDMPQWAPVSDPLTPGDSPDPSPPESPQS